MLKKTLLVIILLIFQTTLWSWIKAIWVPAWELTSKQNIDQLIRDAQKNGIDQILPEIRYRADCLYIPNKRDTTFSNPEKRSYLLDIHPNFDPLEYLIKKAKPARIEIHAWLTTFVTTVHDSTKITPEHIYKQKPEWITFDYNKQPMNYSAYEGAYLDPGVPQVHLYLLNIIMDIIKNYDLDGIHLDYIRYPDTQFGYNDLARKFYKYDFAYQDHFSWQNWKVAQINSFLKKVYLSIKNQDEDIVLSAAVIPYIREARYRYAQDWLTWLNEDYLDYVYLMAYTYDNGDFKSLIENINSYDLNKKIITGLRAWHGGTDYPVDKINDKIKISRSNHYAGICLFSYTGIKQHNYFPELRLK